MGLDIEKNYSSAVAHNAGKLDLTDLDLEIDVADIDQYPNEQYALLRKRGLGTSDSSILLGVNPYTTYAELIQEKCRSFLTPEEKAVGDKAAVKKGRDLEPIIIEKHSKIVGTRILKPTDMYRHKDYPWVKFNFDGVIDKIDLPSGKMQYIPDEIKVVTMYGQKHYDPTKAYFRESQGFKTIPENYSITNNSIETKAAMYGIPAYYYTQLQQQIFGLNAPFGYLTVMFDTLWEVISFFVWRDDATIQQLLINGYKAWDQICAKTGDENYADVSGLIEKFKGEA